MGDFWAIAGVILTAFGIWLAIKYDYKKDPADERIALLALFNATKREYEEFISELKSFCAQNNFWSAHIDTGVTYISFIQELENVLNVSFNDQMFNEIKSLSDNKPAIDMFRRNIEAKHTEISAMRARLRLIKQNIE